MEEKEEVYPIDERYKDCSLFLAFQEMEKRVEKLEAEFEELRKSKKDMSNRSIPSSQNKYDKSLVGRQPQILLFLEKIIPITNNSLEQALRNHVTKRNVSGCFRREEGSDCNNIISSIIETAKKLNVYIFDALSPNHAFVF